MISQNLSAIDIVENLIQRTKKMMDSEMFSLVPIPTVSERDWKLALHR